MQNRHGPSLHRACSGEGDADVRIKLKNAARGVCHPGRSVVWQGLGREAEQALEDKGSLCLHNVNSYLKLNDMIWEPWL